MSGTFTSLTCAMLPSCPPPRLLRVRNGEDNATPSAGAISSGEAFGPRRRCASFRKGLSGRDFRPIRPWCVLVLYIGNTLTFRGSAAMLTIRDLSKTYANGVQALKGVALDIPKGMFGLLGPNGAGKSTLMRTIATLQDADSGSIRLNDLDVLANKSEARRVLGYLPQEFGVYPKVSAEAMLDHFAVLKGVTARGERKALVEALLKQVNLWDVRKRKLGTFSGGMRQRFGIAQALIGNPQLIIVDEPTAGLDPEERNRFLNLLADIGGQVVVILSTHIVEDVTDLCPRMAIISKGQVLLTGEPRQAIEAL